MSEKDYVKDGNGNNIYESQVVEDIINALYSTDQYTRSHAIEELKCILPEVNAFSYASDIQKQFLNSFLQATPEVKADDLYTDDVLSILEDYREENILYENTRIGNNIFEIDFEDEDGVEFMVVKFDFVDEEDFHLIKGRFEYDGVYPLGNYTFTILKKCKKTQITMDDLLAM